MHNQDKSNSTWEKFWRDNPTGFNSTMAQATLFFAKTLDRELPILPSDRILDIGCGPGFLDSYLTEKAAFVYGTDISEKYIQICNEQFANNDKTSFSVSKVYDFESYKDLIISNQINKVILLSVLQYYKSEDEVSALIKSFKETASVQKFSCLLADIIPTKHSTISDIFSIIKHAIKRGYTLKFARFLFYALFSDYRKMKKAGLLQLDESFFIALGEQLSVKVRIIKNLTVHTDRYSVLIDF